MKVNLDRTAFTKHSQHMNAMGKELVAKKTVEAIKHTLKVLEKTSIIKWKEDTNKENQGPGEAKNGVGEGRDPTENQIDSVQAEDNNSRQQRDSGDSFKKKSQDTCKKEMIFLWTATSKKQAREKRRGKNKDSSQAPRNKSLKIFHQNIRGLGNKTNEPCYHLHHDLPHILCLSEDHLSESKLQLIHLTKYSLGVNYCRKIFLKGGVRIFVYTNLKYNSINIDEYNIHKDTEACAIQLDVTFNKLCILAIYRSPRGNFTNFIK